MGCRYLNRRAQACCMVSGLVQGYVSMSRLRECCVMPYTLLQRPLSGVPGCHERPMNPGSFGSRCDKCKRRARERERGGDGGTEGGHCSIGCLSST